MPHQQNQNYIKIAKAIEFISLNFKEQPSLELISQAVGLSPFHFQRLFTQWAGVSPKKFMQYLSLEYAKGLLKNEKLSLLDTSYETGLSGTSRLHDLFVKIEAMTPGEYKNGGEQLDIRYQFSESVFGNLLIASTEKGICHLSFEEDNQKSLTQLKQSFPNANHRKSKAGNQENALQFFQKNWQQIENIKLHLKGSPFQLKVWESLLKIPKSCLTSYGSIAKNIDKPNASRAVGTAIGSNPVAFLIPCHRVIQANGNIGEYRWGNTRKSAMIGWEAASKIV